MSETLQFHPVEVLEMLTVDDLAALWELVPTERQKAYRAAYDHEVRDAGASGTDELELMVTRELLRRYRDDALVPLAASRWARTPNRVREAARQNADIANADASANHPRTTPSLAVIVSLTAAFLLLVGLLLSRVWSNDESPVAVATTPDIALSPTLQVSPTPTPMALEEQDAIIRSGDNARLAAYPVGLHIRTADGDAPRVWVVQRRSVQVSEWHYDPNPDTASFVGGMTVRPVIGVPWSTDNAALFDRIADGARFTLTLNTGAVQEFVFAGKREVLRSETGIFRQVAPGLVLLLIGETDEVGLPTAMRTLVTATYPPEQELGRLGEVIPVSGVLSQPEVLPTETVEPTLVPFAGLDVQLISVTTQPGRLTTVLRLYNGSAVPQTFAPDDISLTLGYAPQPVGPRNPAAALQPFTLQPEQAVDLTLAWYWGGEPFGVFQFGRYRFAIQFT